MEKNNIETRSSTFNVEGRKIEGYQIVFNSWSVILNDHFREIILPTAINMDTVDASDIFATLCHDRTRPLARRRNGKGTLDISIDDHGLKYRFELANTQVQNEVFEYIKRGELTQSSFQFTDVDSKIKQGTDGIWERTVTHINNLYDVSQVFEPQYSMSEVNLRSIQDAKKKIEDENLEKAKKEIEARQLALDEYHKKLKTRILSL